MSGKIFDLTPESEGPRHPVRRAASWEYGPSAGEVYLARKMALEQAADDALLGAQRVVRRRAARGQTGGEDAVTLALTLRRHGFDEEEWEREVRRAVALQAEGTAYLARKREERLRRQAAEAEAGVLQAQAEVGREGGALSPELSGRIGAKRGGGQPLEATVRQGMEGVFQVSFGHVRIHADPEADALNRGVAAIAFTVGSDIFFRAGAYQPHSAAGQHLLAHELTHVVQQRTGSLGTSGGNAGGGTMTVGAADDRHEQEAEATAHRVTAALQARGQVLTAPATSPGAALSRVHDPAVALAPAASGVTRVPDLTVRRFGLGDLWQAVTSAASAAWGGFTGALRGIAQAGYNAVTGTLHWAQAVVTGAGQLAGQAVTVVANAAHNATQFAITVSGKVVGLVSQVTAQAIGQVMQTVAAARTALAAVTSMAAFLGRKLHDAPAAFVQALQDKAHQVLMGVLGPDVSAILGSAATTMTLILKDPLKFLNNLGLALKAGFGMVSRNLWGVLQGGLMSWLSGSLGVTIPDGAVKFDVAGIITLGLNALHLGYDALKAGVIAGLTKHGVKDPATVVGRLETGALAGFTLLQTIRGKGLAGAWDALTQQVRDSLGAALDGAKAAVMQWVEQRVVQGVIAQLVALCTPVGDIVELLLTIYKAVQFFLDKMHALGRFMATLKDAVTRVAHGDVWHAGAQVYNAVVASVPLLLGFIANLLGLGDVGAAVRNALAALTAPVRRIEAKLVALIVSKGQALVATLHNATTRNPRHTPISGHGTDPAHDAQVHAGVQELVTLDQPYAKEGIKKVQAEAIAARVHREHPVFKSIDVVDGGDRWNYKYVATLGEVTGVYKVYFERAQGHFTAAHGKAKFTRSDLASFLHLGLPQADTYVSAWIKNGELFWCDWDQTELSFDKHEERVAATGNEIPAIDAAINACSGLKRGDRFIAFMTAMAQKQTIKGIDRATLKTWYQHQVVKDYLALQLRSANKGNHEWIPCQLIMDVIDRAASYDDDNESVRWIEMQHLLRTDTSWIIFKPIFPIMATELHGYTVLRGHTDAVYLEEPKGAPREQQITGVADNDPFHAECCAAFSGGGPTRLPKPKTVNECIDNVKAVFTRWVWNGEEPRLPLHPQLWTKRVGGLNIAANKETIVSNQKTRYSATESMLETVRDKANAV